MRSSSAHIQRVYLLLTLFSTLSASLIWGINTIFLLDAGLSNTQAFLANAFFTIGQVIFEVPTGMIADLRGRRTSYILGTLTLAISTAFYLIAWSMSSPLWVWAIASVLLGLGFTFFSGATEAWLVDALEYSGYKGRLESVFAKAQMIGGIAMLVGSLGGGILAQVFGLAVPYIVRTVLLLVTFVIAFIWMHDWGFTPEKHASLLKGFHSLFGRSLEFGWKHRSVRWMMCAGPFISGVGFYAFYALQPYLLELYGDRSAYGIAGLAAAIVAGAQIVGGLCAIRVKEFFSRRTSVLILTTILTAFLLSAVGWTSQFWLAIIILCLWGLLSSLAVPVRQAYMNGIIPSKERATVLSFDSLVGSSGGAIIQPVLGRVADQQSYASSFLAGALIQGIALPFIILARREKPSSDTL